MEIVTVGVPLCLGVLVMKYFHKIPSRAIIYHYGAAWCLSNRDACVLRKEKKQEYLKINAPEVTSEPAKPQAK